MPAASGEIDESLLHALQSAVLSPDIIIFYFDSRLRFTGYDTTNKSLLFVPPEKFMGKRHNEVLPPDVARAFEAAVGKIKRTHKPVEYEYSLGIRKEKRHFSATLAAVPEPDKPSGFVAVVRDITGLEHGIVELAESEKRYASLSETVPEMMLVISRGMELVHANAFALRSMKKTIGKKEGMKIEELLSSPNAAVLSRDVERAFRTGKPFYSEDKLFLEGKSAWVGTWHALIKNYVGGTDAVLNISRDITGRKEAEEKLRESEKKYPLLVEKAHDAVLILQEGRVKFANKAMESLSGMRMDEIIGARFLDFIVPEQREMVAKRYRARIGSRKAPSNYEIVALAKGGVRKNLEISAAQTAYEGMPADLVWLHDVTERNKLEQETRYSKELAEKYLHLAGSMIVTLDSNGRITLMNRAGCEMFCGKKCALVGKDWFENCLPPEARKETRAYFMGRMGKKLSEVGTKPEYHENKVLTKNGEMRLVSWYNSWIADGSGIIVGALSAGRDVTERRQAETRVRSLNKLLRAATLINQGMAKQSEPGQLLSDSCELLVKAGGFALAWVGMADFRTRKVTPVAWAGKGKGYARRISIRCDNTPQGRGPTGTAIRTGKYVICKDIEKDPGFAPWRNEAKRRGYASSGAFPLRVRGKVVGALNVYCAQAGVDISEFAYLIDELAKDIGYALEAMEAHAARKKAEERMGWLASFPESNPSPIIEADREGNVTYMNPVAKKRFPELIREKLKHPVLAGLKEKLSVCHATMEKPFVRDIEANGRHYEETAYCIIEIMHMRLYLRDITERKTAEDAEKASELRYRRLFESAKDGILILDFNTGMIVDVNPFLTSLLGYSREEFLKRHLWEIGVFKDIAESKAGFRKLKAKDYIRYEDLPIETRGGKKVDVEFVSNVYLVGDRKVIQCNVRNITERRKAEEALKESEERYRAIFNDAILGIYQSTPEGRYLRVNPAFARIGGYASPKEMMREVNDIGRQMYANPEDRARLVKLLTGKGHIADFVTQIRQKNGNLVWISINSRAVKGAKGKILYYEGTIEDITERKEIEDALKQSEERYKAIVENSLAGIAIIGLDGKIMAANKAAADIIEFGSPEAGVGKSVFGVVAPESRPKLVADFANVLKGKGGYLAEYKILTAKGREKWIDNLGTKITYLGKPAIIININDITERKKAAAGLKESEERYRMLFESANDGIFVLDTKGFIVSVNGKVAEISGYPMGYFPKKHISQLEFIPLRDKLKMLSEFAQRAFGRQGQYEIDIITKSGETVPVEINSSPIMQEGRFRGAIALVRDVRERKRAGAEKEKERGITRGIVEGAAIPIFVLGVGHKVIYWNKACEELTWWKAADMVGTKLQWKPLYAKERMTLADYVLDKKEPKQGEYAILRKSVLAAGGLEAEGWYDLRGEQTYLLTTAAPIKDAQGNVLGVVETLLDMTEKKRAEELLKNESANLEAEVGKRTAELKAEIQKVERLSIVKDEFIRNVTHELKTPLSVILLNIPLAKKMGEAGKDRERDELLDMMERNAARLRNSIEDILELSRIGGTTEYRKEKVELKTIMDYVKEAYAPIAKRKGIGLEISYENAAVLGDPSLLPYTVSNLVSNAVKFTDKGKVSVNAHVSGKEVVILVSDTGTGISKQNQAKLFTKFFKADASAPGTGVGLAIVKEIVEGHGGRIGLKSELGKGSTFTVTLPRA